MSEEEKEAFKVLKGLEFYEYEWYVRTDKIEGHANEVVGEVEKAIKIIVNLIEKQQKEIEKLKSKKYILNAETNEIKEIPISDDYISKDKIKEYINSPEFLDWHLGFKLIDELEYRKDRINELLGE